jgi:hypothetical protein
VGVTTEGDTISSVTFWFTVLVRPSASVTRALIG